MDWKSGLIYSGIVVVVGVVLYLSKLGIVMSSEKDDEGKETTHLSYLKLLMWTVVISTPIIIGVYVYFYRKKTDF